MAWSSSRSAAASVVRERAHSDDAKHRTHDAHHAPQARFPKWTLPVAAGVAVVVIIGGTTTVLASHRGAPVRHSATPRQAAGASGDQDGPADPTTATSPTPAGLAGRSFTIRGVEHKVFKPYNGYPGSKFDKPSTYKVTCDATSCSVSIPDLPTRRLVAAGTNTYRAAFVDHSPPGDTVVLHYPATETLTVEGKRATVVYRNQGAFKRQPNVTTTQHPGTRTLSGPIHFTD